MRRIKIIVVVAALAFTIVGGWRIGAVELANLELQEDMHDLAAQAGAHIGYTTLRTDDDFRDAVIRKAKEYNIELAPHQVTVQRNGPEMTSPMYLAADYSVPVNLPQYSFTMHFTPSSTKKSF